MPPGVEISQVKWNDRREGPEQYNIHLLFECTDDCSTILTRRHYNEMNRYLSMVEKNENWPTACVRLLDGTLDGNACSAASYTNFTTLFPKEYISQWNTLDQENIDYFLKDFAAKQGKAFNQELFGKNFSVSDPRSNLLYATLRLTNDIYVTNITYNSTTDEWKEKVYHHLDKEESEELRYNLTMHAYEIAKNF
jgi:hypothetical protein